MELNGTPTWERVMEEWSPGGILRNSCQRGKRTPGEGRLVEAMEGKSFKKNGMVTM